MQSMQPMGQNQSPLMNTFSKLSAIAAFILTVFFVPAAFAHTKGFIANMILEEYGISCVEWAVYGWAALCAWLMYHLINFVLQSLIMLGALALARRIV